LRKEEAAKKDLQRLAHLDKNNNDVKRGVSMATQINHANINIRKRELEILQKEARNQKRENTNVNLNVQIGNMYMMLDWYENRAKQYTSGYNKDNFPWKKVMEQEGLIEAAQEKLEKLNLEKEDFTKETFSKCSGPNTGTIVPLIG
jgi:hypothetical protein